MKYNIARRGLAIYQDKTTLFKNAWQLLLGWVLLVPLAFAYNSKKRMLRAISIIFGIVLFLLDILLAPTWLQLLFLKPIFVMDDEGIRYQPLSTLFLNLNMKISWEEIAMIYPIELTLVGKKRAGTYRFLAIVPKDHDAFVQREKILSLRKLPTLVLMSRTKIPFTVLEQPFAPHSLNEILTYIDTYYQKELQAHAIELSKEVKVLD